MTTSGTSAEVGWVGAGRMGSAMVRRLREADIPVTVWNRTTARAQQLGKVGAIVATDLAAVASCPIVVSSLASSSDLCEVVGQLLAAAETPSVLVDTSTVSMTASAAVRERCGEAGVAYLAAPVSGNPSTVAAGAASFVCSGSPTAFDRARWILERIGRTAIYVGAGEESRLIKICHNLLLAVTTQTLAEVVVLGEKLGVPRDRLMDFINTSVVGSAFTSYKTPAICALDMSPTFTSSLLLKDLDLGLAEAGRAAVPLPVIGLVRAFVQSAVAQGHAEDDFLSLLLLQAKAAGIDLPAPTSTPPERQS